jgi:hypothetical protein
MTYHKTEMHEIKMSNPEPFTPASVKKGGLPARTNTKKNLFESPNNVINKSDWKKSSTLTIVVNVQNEVFVSPGGRCFSRGHFPDPNRVFEHVRTNNSVCPKKPSHKKPSHKKPSHKKRPSSV